MGYASMLFAVGMILIGGFLAFGMQRDAGQADAEVAVYHHQVQARGAALTGLNLAARNLLAHADRDTSIGWTPKLGVLGFDTTAFGRERFVVAVDTVSVASAPAECGPGYTPGLGAKHRVKVTATGLSSSFDGLQRHVIEACYELGLTASGLPPAFQNVMAAETRVIMNGNIRVKSPFSNGNADVYTNGKLTSNGNVRVEGYGFYGDGSPPNPSHFVPNNDTNGPEPNVIEVSDEIDIPAFDPSPFSTCPSPSSLCSGTVTPDTLLNGNQSIDLTNWAGVTGKGTAADPFIWYVNGNLKLNGNITFSGHLMVVATGSIILNGNVTTTPAPMPSGSASDGVWRTWIQENMPAGSTVGFYAGGNITLNGGNSVVGHLVSNGAVTLNGGGGVPNVIGGVIAQQITANGNFKIWYNTLSTSVMLPGMEETIPEGLRLIAFSEWTQH